MKIWSGRIGQNGGASGQTGGRESEGSSEKFCEEIFFRDGLNWLSTHRGFQIYPILAGQKFCWLRK